MKWIIKALAAVVVLLVLAVVAAGVMLAQFDPNDHKARIEAAVSQAAGRTLTITGPIKATYFPVLGFDIQGLTMDQPSGYGSGTFLSVKDAQAGVKVAPLFKKQVEITKVTLNEPAIHIIKQVNGNTNLGFPKREKTAESHADGMAMDLSVEQIAINNASLTYEDKKTGQKWAADSVNVTLPGFKPGASTPIKVAMNIKGGDNMQVNVDASGTMKAAPAAGTFALTGMQARIGLSAPGLTKPVTIAMHGDMMLDQKAEKLNADNFKISWDGTDITTSLGISGFVQPHVTFKAAAENIDVDSLGAAFKKKEAAANDNKDLMPFDLLKKLVLNGSLSVNNLKMSQLSAQNLSADIRSENRILKIEPIKAGFYDGTMTGAVNVNLQSDTPTITVKGDLQKLQVGKLMQAKTGQDYLSGLANFNIDLKSTGRNVASIKRSAGGLFTFDFGEGYINKWQLSKRINQAIAYFETGKLDENASDKIYFTSLDGKFTGQNGVFSNSDLVLLAPKSHALGAGKVDLGANKVDYNLRVGLGDDPANLTDSRHLPIRITGPLSQPQYGLDMQALIQDVAGEKIEKKKDELLNKALGKLTGSKEEPATTTNGAAPADGAAATEEQPASEADPAQMLKGLFGGN